MKKKNTKENILSNRKKNFKRILAFLIDWYIGGMAAGVPVMLIYSIESGEATIAKSLSAMSFQWGIVAGIAAIIASLAYYMLIPTYLYNGQTLGKKLLGIKVTHLDDTNVTLKTLFRREFLGVMIIEGGIVSGSEYLRQITGMVFNSGVYDLLGIIATIITTISIIIVLFKSENRMIHDYIGRTKVVEV